MEAKGPRDGREKRNKWKTNGKKSQCISNMLATYWELGENMALAGAQSDLFGKYAHGSIWSQKLRKITFLLSFNTYFGSLQVCVQ